MEKVSFYDLFYMEKVSFFNLFQLLWAGAGIFRCQK
jgi:hypothetical protein